MKGDICEYGSQLAPRGCLSSSSSFHMIWTSSLSCLSDLCDFFLTFSTVDALTRDFLFTLSLFFPFFFEPRLETTLKCICKWTGSPPIWKRQSQIELMYPGSSWVGTGTHCSSEFLCSRGKGTLNLKKKKWNRRAAFMHDYKVHWFSPCFSFTEISTMWTCRRMVFRWSTTRNYKRMSLLINNYYLDCYLVFSCCLVKISLFFFFPVHAVGWSHCLLSTMLTSSSLVMHTIIKECGPHSIIRFALGPRDCSCLCQCTFNIWGYILGYLLAYPFLSWRRCCNNPTTIPSVLHTLSMDVLGTLVRIIYGLG